MRIEIRADTDKDPLLKEFFQVFEGSRIDYSRSVNAYTDGKVLMCFINGEEKVLKGIKKPECEEVIKSNRRTEPKDRELKAWFDECVQKRWGHHLVLRRFVYDMPKRPHNLDSITLRKTRPPKWKNYKNDYKQVWFSETELVLEKLRKFIKLWTKGKVDIHPRDFVWIATTEYAELHEDVHIHILLNELSSIPPKEFEAIVGAFNDEMKSSSMTNKLRGFYLHASGPIKPTPSEYEYRVKYVLKDESRLRKHVFHSKYYRQFISDPTSNVYQELL